MKEIDCIVLAAGEGRRLGLDREAIPKVMAGLYDRPMLQFSLKALSGLNPDELVIVVGHFSGVVKKHFGGGINYQLQKVLDGNGGALRVGFEGRKVRTRNILVIQGDDSAFLDSETLRKLVAIRENSGALASVLVTRNFSEGTHEREFVLGDYNRLIGLSSEHLDIGNGVFSAGAVCFSREFLEEYLPHLVRGASGEVEIPQLFELALRDSRRVLCLIAPSGEWVGVNSPKDLEIARRLMSEKMRISR